MKYSFEPLIGKTSKVLILGSLPGAASLAAGQYYAHKYNHFWPIIFAVLGSREQISYYDKCRLLLDSKLALWDVARSAEREGSLDSRIKNLEPNDITALLTEYPSIRFLIFNGGFAFSTYKKHFGTPALPCQKVLSTSPACAGRYNEKLTMWREAVKKGLSEN